jgi:hypothetical protein
MKKITLTTLFLFGMAAGCGSRSSVPPERVTTGVDVLRDGFPEQAPLVLDRGEALVAAEEHYAAGDAQSGVRALLPKDGAGVLRFTAHGAFEVRVREAGLAGAAERAHSSMAYRRTGGTSFWTVDENGAEEWLLLGAGHVRRGAPVATWSVEGATLRQVGDVVLLADARGVPRLRVTAPAAFAKGNRPIAARLRVAGDRIELLADADHEDLLIDPAWTSTAALATARQRHAATRLANGSVLVTGGQGSSLLASAELYNPANGTWSPAASMSAARADHTSTLLADGRVLVVGNTAAAEVYDPSTNTWSATGLMNVTRAGHVAVRLANGRVLVAGHNGSAAQSVTAEIYDPATNTWTSTGAMNTGRYSFSANLLQDGRVLVAGGFNVATNNYLTSAELYDPTAGSWTTTGSLATRRFQHLSADLADGRVMIANGTNGASLTSVEIYNPGTGLFSPGPSTASTHLSGTGTALADGKVLIVGGLITARTEVYDPTRNAWALSGSLAATRYRHAATLLANGKVLVMGGVSGSSTNLATAELFDQLVLGGTCAQNGECLSGFCVDGVCCNTACNAGTCDACSVAAGAPTNGTCAPVAAGTTCRAATGPCDRAETCDGTSLQCPTDARQPGGTLCRAVAGSCDSPETCDGTGTQCPADAQAPDGTACNDGNGCTQTDTCRAGVCNGANPVTCAAPGACRTAGTCNPATGQCDYPAVPDGTACDDSNNCTLVDACQAGACVGQGPVTCPASTTANVGFDTPTWSDATQPCSDPNQPCDDGNLGPAQPDTTSLYPIDLYTAELTPFLLHGPFSIADCTSSVARRLTGGDVRLHNTNLTAFDFAGNDFVANDRSTNSLVDPNVADYGYMLQRLMVTPGPVNTYINYVFDSVLWEYQGSKATRIYAPIATSPANPFTAPVSGDLVIPIQHHDMVSLRLRVLSTGAGDRMSALRFHATSTDGKVSAGFVSDRRIAGTLSSSNVLTPDPASVGGIVYTTNQAQQETIIGEVLVKPGYTYTIHSAAVEFLDLLGQPLNEVALPGASITIPAGCGTYTVDLSIKMPAGRLRGQMHFVRDPADAADVGPRATSYLPSYFGYTDANRYDGNRLGYTIYGGAKRLRTDGASPEPYDYLAISEERWLNGSPYEATVLGWPASTFGPGASRRGGEFRWPNPGINAVSPVDVASNLTTGLDLDGFTFVLDPDVLTTAPPRLLPSFEMKTEEINLVTPMAYLQGNVDLAGCITTADIRSGLAGLSGLRNGPGTPFVDEKGIRRQSVTGTDRGSAAGVFRGDGTGRFEIVASEGPWLEGGYHLDLIHRDSESTGGCSNPSVPGCDCSAPYEDSSLNYLSEYYNGAIGFWKAPRAQYNMQPGRSAEITAASIQNDTGRVWVRLRVHNSDGTLRPFRSPSLYFGDHSYTAPNGALARPTPPRPARASRGAPTA